MSKSSVPCKRAMRSSGLSWEGIRPKLGIILDRKSTRLNSSHLVISYAVFCLKKKSCPVDEVQSEKLAGDVDLILVLGGDGTMIATARMIGDQEVPVIVVNYCVLGYLAEFHIE